MVSAQPCCETRSAFVPVSRRILSRVSLLLSLTTTGCERPPTSPVNPNEPNAPSEPEATLSRQRPANSGPDIILYIVDDQSWHSFTRPIMPQTYTRLVDVGTLFRLGFVVTADCCPSRVGLLAGVFQHNPFHHVYGDMAPAGGATAWHGDGDALPVWMQTAGYYTAYAGPKYLNEWYKLLPSPYVPPGGTHGGHCFTRCTLRTPS
jgi:hypothetical protein